MRAARGLALISAALAFGACKGKGTPAGEGGEAAAGSAASGKRSKPAGDWRPSCQRTLAGLGEVAPEQRARAILEGCPVCDPGPLLLEREGMQRTAEYSVELDAAVQRCGGYCTKLARTDFLRMIQHQLDTKEPSARPWRQLAEACPAELGWRESSRGFTGATWFLLERTAKIAGAELAAPLAAATSASFPLPPVAPEGRGLGLPAPAGGPRALPGRLVITVLAEGAMVGRLPWARLAAAGVIVDGEYPGAAAKDGELIAALAAAEVMLQEAAVVASGSGESGAALDASSITLAAPVALPARRLVEILRQIKRPARLAVRAPTGLPEYALAMTLPPSLIAAPIAGAAELALDDTAELTAASARRAPVTLRLAAESTVAELAAALATLGAAPQVALLAPAPNPTPTPSATPPATSSATPSAAKP